MRPRNQQIPRGIRVSESDPTPLTAKPTGVGERGHLEGEESGRSEGEGDEEGRRARNACSQGVGGCRGAEHRGLVVKVSVVSRPIDQVTCSSVGKSGSGVDSRFGVKGLKVTAYNQSDERVRGESLKSFKVTNCDLRE